MQVLPHWTRKPKNSLTPQSLQSWGRVLRRRSGCQHLLAKVPKSGCVPYVTGQSLPRSRLGSRAAIAVAGPHCDPLGDVPIKALRHHLFSMWDDKLHDPYVGVRRPQTEAHRPRRTRAGGGGGGGACVEAGHCKNAAEAEGGGRAQARCRARRAWECVPKWRAACARQPRQQATSEGQVQAQAAAAAQLTSRQPALQRPHYWHGMSPMGQLPMFTWMQGERGTIHTV